MLDRSAIQTIGARLLTLVASFATSILTARALGPEGRGQYYLVLMLAALAVQLGNFGLHASNTYLAARDPSRFSALLSNSLWLSIVSGVVLGALVILWDRLSASTSAVGFIVYWLIAYTPAALFSMLAANLLLGIGRVAAFNGIQLTTAVLTLAAVALVTLMDGGVASFVVAATGAMLATAFLCIAISGANMASLLYFDFQLFVTGLQFASRAYLVGLLSFLVLRVNVFLLGLFVAPEQMGYYSIAMQFVDVLVLLPTAVSAVLFPNLVRSQTAWRDTRLSIRTIAIIMIPLCMITIVAVDELIEVIFGPAFAPAAGITRALLPAVLSLSVISVLSQYLASVGYPKQVIGIWMVAVLAAILAGTILIHAHEAMGAALALSIVYGAVLLAMWCFTARLTQRNQVKVYEGEVNGRS